MLQVPFMVIVRRGVKQQIILATELFARLSYPEMSI